MHPFLMMAVGHIIVVAVLAFFVLFAAGKADGFVKLLGNVLGWLLLILAVLMIVATVAAPFMGWHKGGDWHHPMWGPSDHATTMQPPAKH